MVKVEGAAVNQEFSLLLCDISVIQKPRSLVPGEASRYGKGEDKKQGQNLRLKINFYLALTLLLFIQA